MKRMKKIFAVLIAMVMVLSMGTSVFAAEGDLEVDGQIQVLDLAEGDAVTYYQVLEWVDGTGWAFKAPFDSLADADLEQILGTEDEAGSIDQALATRIAAAATSGGVDGGTVDSTGVWTLEGPDAGLYMVVIAAAEPGVVYNPAFVGADYRQPKEEGEEDPSSIVSIEEQYSDKAMAKKTTFIVEKTEEDTDREVAEAIDSYVGETVTFYIDTTLPVFLPSYTNPSFDIVDSITEGVELDPDSITVTLGPEAPAGAYEIKDADKTGFTVSFDGSEDGFLATNTIARTVHIEYTGTVTNEAEFIINQDENTVEVIYSNGPGNEKGALKDVSNTYTFSLGAALLGDETKKTSELVKVAVENGEYVVEEIELDNEKTVGALIGATFGLYTDKECTTLYTNDLTDGTFTTKEDGIITYKGLAADTYYLKETDAPAGYIKDTTVYKIVIDAQYRTETVTEEDEDLGITITYETEVLDTYTVTTYDAETDEKLSENEYTIENEGPTSTETTINEESFEVPNTPGQELPSTGGIGTTLFYVVGSILVIGAAVILISKRRMSR